MKTIELDNANLGECVKETRKQSVLLTRKGRPLALITSVKGLDAEQIELGQDDEFWRMIEQRRKQKGGVSHAEVKRRLGLR